MPVVCGAHWTGVTRHCPAGVTSIHGTKAEESRAALISPTLTVVKVQHVAKKPDHSVRNMRRFSSEPHLFHDWQISRKGRFP
jgi:hypothetical protein